MDDAAVVPCLVLSDGTLLFENGQSQGRKACQQLHGSGQPNDPCADNRDVISLLRHARATLSFDSKELRSNHSYKPLLTEVGHAYLLAF